MTSPKGYFSFVWPFTSLGVTSGLVSGLTFGFLPFGSWITGLIFGIFIILAARIVDISISWKATLLFLSCSSAGFVIATVASIRLMAWQEINGPVSSLLGTIPLALAYSFLFLPCKRFLCVALTLMMSYICGMLFVWLTDVSNSLPGMAAFIPLSFMAWQAMVASIMGIRLGHGVSDA